MHREINRTAGGMETDHIDGNRLNNIKSNLRSVTHQQNCRNNHKSNSNSGIVGVNWHKGAKRWRAYIHVDYKYKELGKFKDIRDAIKARKEAVRLYWGNP
jgi:hypothetical protein